MRPKLTKLSWVSLERLRSEHFAQTLNTVAGKRVFGEAFFDRLRTRKIEVEKTMWKLTIFNWVLIGALFVNAFVLQTGIHIAGLDASDVGKVKELVLFVSATLVVITAAMGMDVKYMESLGTEWMRAQYGLAATFYTRTLIANIVFDTPNFNAPPRRDQYETKIHKVFSAVFLLLMSIFAIGMFAAMLGVYVTVILDVIEKPSLPFHLSWFVITYAGVAFACQVAMSLYWGLPLPYKDYSLVAELTDLRRSDPSEYERRLREIPGR